MPAFVRAGLLAAALVFCLPAPAALSLKDALVEAAPSADPKVLQLALAAVSCAQAQAAQPARHLAVIDYSRPSTEPRLWVFDLLSRQLLYTELVAHGRNSGDNYARSFSNVVDSHASSLGLFRTRNAYVGRNGYSLRMDGLEAGFNDRAAERAIVMHGAPYVSERFARRQGRLGRSHGCPAVRTAVARPLIDVLKGGNYVFAYYPDPRWLAASAFLNCRTPAPSAPSDSMAAAP